MTESQALRSPHRVFAAHNHGAGAPPAASAGDRVFRWSVTPLVSGNSSRKLWPKFAGIRFLVLTSLDGKDRAMRVNIASLHQALATLAPTGPARQLSAAIKPQRMTSTLIATTSIPGIRLQSIRVKTHSQVSRAVRCPRQGGQTTKRNNRAQMTMTAGPSDLHPCFIQGVDRAPPVL